MSIPIDIILKATGGGAVKSEVQGVATAAKGVDSELKKVGANDGLNKVGASADALKGKLEGVRSAGLGMAAIGGAGMLLAEGLTTAYIEADRLGGKLESMMTGKGLQAGIDQVKALGNEIAGLTGGDDDQVATALAGAIASGRLNGLREYGIVIDDVGKAAIEAAGKISDGAKSQEIFNQVMRAGGDAARVLRAGMDESTVALGEMGVRWGNLEEGIGKGSARVKAALYTGVLAPIFDILEASPGLQETVGMIGSIGATAVTTAGSAFALASQVGITALSMSTMGITGTIAFNAVTVAAGRTALVVGKVLAVALLAAAAMYALDKIWHAKEDRELAANIARGDEAGEKLLVIQNQRRAKKGLPALTMEEFQGDPNIDDKETANDPTVQLSKIQSQYEALQRDGGTSAATPTAPMPSYTVVPSVAGVLASGAQSPKEPPLPPGVMHAVQMSKAQKGMHSEIDTDGVTRQYSDSPIFKLLSLSDRDLDNDDEDAAMAGMGNLSQRVREALRIGGSYNTQTGEISLSKERQSREWQGQHAQGFNLAQSIAALQANGGGMAALMGKGAGAGSTPGAGSQTINIPLNEHIRTSRNALGEIVLNFVGSVTLPQSPLEAAFSSFGP